jgi:hypothetical protein
MGSRIDITRVVDSFSSHTQMHASAQACRTPTDTHALRDRLIAATVEALAEGGDPRLAQTRAQS